MRKLVILGNGFDVSHGLRTKYEEFLFNYLVKCLVNSVKNKVLTKTEYVYEHLDLLIHLKFNYIENGSTRINLLKVDNICLFIEEYNDFRSLMDELINRQMIKSQEHESLLTRIYENKLIYNWVDIEIEYFEKLISILFDRRITSPTDEREISQIGEVEELNCEMDFLKSELVKYLLNVRSGEKFNLNKEKHSKFLTDYKEILFDTSKGEVQKDSILFLNFNYTNVLQEIYSESNGHQVINIHGDLKSDLEDIVFGYGDEDDINFKKLLQTKEKDICLKNYKMYYYSNSGYHSNLMNLLDKNEFVVKIIGHSCGISDSSMFTDILEHENIKGVEIFYYDKNNDGNKNEFKSKNINLSSHFKDIQNWKNLKISFNINNRIPQTPLKMTGLVNMEYVKSEFNKDEISKWFDKINNFKLPENRNKTFTF